MKHSKINQAALSERRYKIINWGIQVKKIKNHFKKTIAQANRNGFFENLYISEDKINRQVQLLSGQHPTGEIEKTQDKWENKSSKLLAESGACIVISQSSIGDVAITLYPYSSEGYKRDRPNIIWAVYPSPTDITDKILDYVTKDFFVYIRVSSTLMQESRIDRLRIRYLELKGMRYHNKNNIIKLFFSHWSLIALGAIGSIASIYSLFK
ncbi:hypothetical protein D3C80_665250 [compost metagenome]